MRRSSNFRLELSSSPWGTISMDFVEIDDDPEKPP